MKNLSDMELRVFGFDILSKILGAVNAERFIALTIREPMDYTAWREKHMYLDEDVHSLAERARATAKRFDAMNGDYTQLRDGVLTAMMSQASLTRKFRHGNQPTANQPWCKSHS